MINKILLTEAARNPKKNRAKMAEIMLEKFGFEGITFEVQALLSLFCEGLDTGLVMDSGDGVSHTIPVSGGYILDDFIQRLNLAGAHVTEYLIKLLLIAGYAFNSSADFEVIRQMKETSCYVSYDIERDRKLSRETWVINQEYKLPNKKKIRIGRERFEAPEWLFDPSLVGSEKVGIPDMIFETIVKCPMDCRSSLYSNILLSGGSTMFPGYPTRIAKDLKSRFKKDIMKGQDYEHNIKINVIDTFRRKHSVFTGGSVLANLSGINWISKATYDEEGVKWLEGSAIRAAK